MIQQKKTYRFSDDTVITEQNIRQIGELIALSSVRTRMIHSTRDLYYVFQNLYIATYLHQATLIIIQKGFISCLCDIIRAIIRIIRRCAILGLARQTTYAVIGVSVVVSVISYTRDVTVFIVRCLSVGNTNEQHDLAEWLCSAVCRCVIRNKNSNEFHLLVLFIYF